MGAILSGVQWCDISGRPIQAHGAGFVRLGDTYYWFGEDKSEDNQTFLGVNCYASKDLCHWEYRNRVLGAKPRTDLDGEGVGERPKVIYNQKTGLYVMFLHIDSLPFYEEARVGTAVCDTVDGDYQYVGSFRPLGSESRDMTVFCDDDATAYLIHSANNNRDILIERLSEDYLTVKDHVCSLFIGRAREAPAVVKHAGMYYLFTSGCRWWAPTRTMYASAPSIQGPWSELRELNPETSYDSQVAYILPVEGRRGTTHIFCADRWYGDDEGRLYHIGLSRYIWLPLALNRGRASLPYYPSWSVDVEDGLWMSTESPGFLVYHTDFETGFDPASCDHSGDWEITDSPFRGSASALCAIGPGIIAFPKRCESSVERIHIQSSVYIDGEDAYGAVLGVGAQGRYVEFALGRDQDGVPSWFIREWKGHMSRTLARGYYAYTQDSTYLLRLSLGEGVLTAAVSENSGERFTILGRCEGEIPGLLRPGLKTGSADVLFDSIEMITERGSGGCEK